MIRTDVHRPSTIIPADYEWVGMQAPGMSGDMGELLFLSQERDRINAHMARTGGSYSAHVHGGVCAVCGNGNALTTVVFWHRPSNQYVIVGHMCAEKLELSYDHASANLFATRCRDALTYQAGKAKARAILEERGLLSAWAIFEASVAGECEEDTIRSIVEKLVRYGSISEAQERFIRTLLDRIPQRQALKAQREVERAAAAPVPEGRLEVTGEVLTLKDVDTPYGITTKMLVRDDRGFKVWGTLPASLAGVDRGSRVRFLAALQASKDDSKFGFFSRPTKGTILETVNVQ